MAAISLALLGVVAVPVSADPATRTIVLPGATSAEGVATGRGTTFYAGDLMAGDIFTGDVRSGEASLLRDAPDGRMAVGMAVDVRRNLLFVAGGATGQGYVYDAATGADIATFDFADPADGTFVNDVTVTRRAAWFTDSAQPRLYRVALRGRKAPGPVTTLELSGPAADVSGQFNLNGIAATPNGKTLIVSHSGNGVLYGIDARTGGSWLIEGVNVPSPDGILYEAGRLYVVQNFLNQVSVVRLRDKARSGTIETVITDPAFQVPTTIARHGSRLLLANAKFGIPNADQYEIVVVRAKRR